MARTFVATTNGIWARLGLSLLAMGSPFATAAGLEYSNNEPLRNLLLHLTADQSIVPVQYRIDDISRMEHVRVMSTFFVDPSALVVAVEVESAHAEEVLHTFQFDRSIQRIEEDSVWTEQGRLDEDEEVSHGRKLRRRRQQAAEQINYGIDMVQGNQVDIGPYPQTVCIVDTGVASGHPDLDYALLDGASRNSNFDNSFLAWNKDVRGHGTHTTGILNAVAGNGLGIQNSMGRIPLFITRGLNDQGRAKESDILSALDQCETAGAKIVSLSLAGPYMSTAMTFKIEDMHRKGFLIFAASGNDGEYKQTFPASHHAVVSVGAVTQARQRWVDSNYGPWVELVGP